jgi:hypothetical protein
MELTDELKATYSETARALKGSDRRVFMARIVQALGPGGQSRAARELGWCRDTIRKGMRELVSDQRLVDNFGARGRKKAEDKLPNLLADIRAPVTAARTPPTTTRSPKHSSRRSSTTPAIPTASARSRMLALGRVPSLPGITTPITTPA